MRTLAILLLLSAGLAPAQPAYELSIARPLLSGTDYQFDIIVKAPVPFRLGNSQCILAFNAAAFTSPALARIAASEQIGSGFFFAESLAGNELFITVGGNGLYSAAAAIPAGGIRIGTYRLSGVNAGILHPNLAWVNPPAAIRTGVSSIDPADNYADITDLTGASHIDGGGEFGIITGSVFDDLNGNGIWDQPAEPPLSGWTITLNGPGGSFSTVSAPVTGAFEFDNVPPGDYALAEVPQAGWPQTAGPAGLLTVTPGGTLANQNFGNFSGPAVGGTIFNDLNGNHLRDPGEPGIAGWAVAAAKTGGGTKNTVTDGSGNYIFAFLPADAGTWTIAESAVPAWVQTFPVSPATYTLTVSSGTFSTGNDFGNQYLPGSISGVVYEDVDGDSLFDGADHGIAGIRVRIKRNGVPFDSLLTGAGGAYVFTGLDPATYDLSQLVPPGGWLQTEPPGGSGAPMSVLIPLPGVGISGVNFGEFLPGVVAGTIYFDLNHNGTQDPGELGMAGMQIAATGTPGTFAATSLPGGAWSIPNLPAGNFTVAPVIPSGYHVLEPPAGSYTASVTSSADISGQKFGLSAAADTLLYRTCSYDSLALSRNLKGKIGKRIKPVPDKVEFSALCVNTSGRSWGAVQVAFNPAVFVGDTCYPFGVTPAPLSVAFASRGRSAVITWADSIHAGDTVTITGWGTRGKPEAVSYKGLSGGRRVTGKLAAQMVRNLPRLPMPNLVNFEEELFLRNIFGSGGILVGTQHTPDFQVYGWVRITKLIDLRRSLFFRNHLHEGTSFGFDRWDVWQPTGQRKIYFEGEHPSLRPPTQDNRVFADLLALKINIAASDAGMLPPGLGDLIYDDGADVLSGKTLRQLAAECDTALTVWYGIPSGTYEHLDSMLQRINSTFEGPVDTASWGTGGLALNGVRMLQGVSYLRANPSVPFPVSKPHAGNDLPTRFELYQNYPNPFNPVTTIRFMMPADGVVDLELYNTLGQKVRDIVRGEMFDAGISEAEFDASGLASGAYIYRITIHPLDDDGLSTGTFFTKSKKLLLLK